MVVLAAAVPAPGPRFLPAGRRRADAPARARAAGHAAGADPGIFRRRSSAQIRKIGRRRPDRRDSRQHRPALQRHQHRAQRLGHRRTDGRRNPDLAQGEAHARPRTSSPQLRRELPKRFPDLQFFFQPADIVDQVLNFGQPAPIDIRISGSDSDETYALAAQARAATCSTIPGVVDSHVFQVPDAPALTIDVDRALAARGRRQPAGDRQQRAGHDQFQRPDRAQFLGRSAQQRQLSAGRAGADLSDRVGAGSVDACRSRPRPAATSASC